MDKIITSSIVLYNTNILELKTAINSVLSYNSFIKLYIIDNSFNNDLRDIVDSESRIIYIHNPSNPGFGAAHNLAISKAIDEGSDYHFIINPDIFFKEDVITPMLNYIVQHDDVGMMMPQILNSDGSEQYLPKLLPTPFSILMRKFTKLGKTHTKFVNKYEMRGRLKDNVYNVPVLSGCFTLLNLKAIKDVGMYDDRFFMYFEDWDLSRRMHREYKTIYYPLVSVYHGYFSGANKSFNLFKIFFRSAFIYFNKWGWFFDEGRKEINKKALAQVN